MKRYLSLLMGILGFVPILAQQSDYYYYYKGERIYLTVDSTRLFVVSEGEFQPQETTRTSATEYNISKSSKSYVYNNVVPLQKKRTATPEVYFTTLDVPEGTDASQYDVLMSKVSAEEDVWQVLPSFTNNGSSFGVSNNFYVKLKSADDLGKLEQMAAQYGTEIIGNNRFMPLWYTLSCNAASSKNAIEAANLFHESQLFACSEPEFCYSMALHSDDSEDSDDDFFPNDPYYPQQWNLKNTGEQEEGIAGIDINVEGAWGITKGGNVVVAVIDQGIHKYHPDLAANMHSDSYDAMTDSSPSVLVSVSNSGYAHGTSCAGIIGAVQDNGIGLSGVAPEVELMDISIDLRIGYFTAQQVANTFNWAWDDGKAHVISCSWGNIGKHKFIDEAIDNALSKGRDGKGCVIVFSSGNEGYSYINYPANYDPRIIVVGGINPWGKRTIQGKMEGGEYYVDFSSCYGEHLDVVAPSVLILSTTIHIDGEWGYTYSRYDGAFRGTSSACPHVAGVAALMLSVNPDMPVEAVEYIIGKTARKVRDDVYSYQKYAAHECGTWNNEVGYGLVDATAAVELAKKPTVYVWNQSHYEDADGFFSVSDKDIDVKNVTVGYGEQLHIFKNKKAVLRSSVRVEEGGEVLISYPLEE